MNYSPLRNICYRERGRRMRSSSYDRTGGNADYVRIKAQRGRGHHGRKPSRVHHPHLDDRRAFDQQVPD